MTIVREPRSGIEDLRATVAKRFYDHILDLRNDRQDIGILSCYADFKNSLLASCEELRGKNATHVGLRHA